MRYDILTYFFSFFLLSLSSYGQEDSVLTLEAVNITAKLRQYPIGNAYQQWDQPTLKQHSHQNLASFLSQESGIFIKNYGAGSLATSSIRGGSASQTLVLWNGLPIQNPMLGQLDLSLIPLIGLSNVQLSKGGQSSLWGSGAIGGTISLNSELLFEKKVNIQAQSSLGSFNSFQQQARVHLGNNRFQSSTSFSTLSQKNDFPFRPYPDADILRQSNNHLKQSHLLQHLGWKVSETAHWQLDYWYQETEREIPPTLTQNRSEAKQVDQSHRMSMSYKQEATRAWWQLKTAWFEELLDFEDPQILLESETRFHRFLSEANGEWNLSQAFNIFVGSTYSYTRAKADAYLSDPLEEKISVFSSGLLKKGDFQLKIDGRQEWVNGERIPFTPSAGLSIKFKNFGKLSIKGSRNYRLPTLNDRFWLPGGNPELLPESGWSQEIGWKKSWLSNNSFTSLTLNVFNRSINNWILWSITDGQSYWSANNVSRVWSRGIEIRAENTFQWRNAQLKIDLAYDYIKSTNQQKLEQPRIEKGSQLWYTPIHQGHIGSQLKINNLSIEYRQQFTGASLGLNENIHAYDIAHLNIDVQTNRWKWIDRCFLHIHNLWNQPYVIIERRPMPGIHFSNRNILFVTSFKQLI